MQACCTCRVAVAVLGAQRWNALSEHVDQAVDTVTTTLLDSAMAHPPSRLSTEKLVVVIVKYLRKGKDE